MRTINVINKSTVVSPADFQNVLNALQTQVSKDFYGPWGINCAIAANNPALANSERIYIMDNTDQADALGYHEEINDIPVGFVFAKTDIENGESWSATLSHELLEQLADPLINQGALGTFKGKPAWYAWEVCDPVENDEYAINGVKVSNFVLPDWFCVDGKKFDFMGKLKKPFTLSPGGYFSYQLKIGRWQSAFGEKVKALAKPKQSRHSRRHAKVA